MHAGTGETNWVASEYGWKILNLGTHKKADPDPQHCLTQITEMYDGNKKYSFSQDCKLNS